MGKSKPYDKEECFRKQNFKYLRRDQPSYPTEGERRTVQREQSGKGGEGY